MENIPRIGVGVLILKDNKILLGKRISTHGKNTWAPPGGHLEFNEQIEECAIREVKEETNLEIKNLRIGPITNDIHKDEDKHYVTIFVISEYKSGNVKLMEPEKCEQWNWFEWSNLPQPLFLPLQNLIKQDFNPLK